MKAFRVLGGATMKRLAAVAAVLALAPFLLAACADTEEARQRNEELMASLPVYPGATLVQKYVIGGSIDEGPVLWHVYATSTDGEGVRTFYKQNLADLGWRLDFSKDSVELIFHKNGAEADLVLYDPGLPLPDLGVKVTPVATPPTGTVSLFAIRVSH
jgi:hypothetical protein